MVVMAQHLNGTPPRLDRVDPSISPQFAAIVATSLARNPDDRYSDMNAFIQALDHPDDADLAILDKMDTPNVTAVSLTQLQVIRGILIGVGIIAGLVVLALALQYLHH
jgi:hypothetical protein